MAYRNPLALLCRTNLRPVTIIPRRNRYYWEARPENKWRKMLMQVTLPRLGKSPEYEARVRKVNEEKLFGLDLILHHEAQELFQNCKMVAVFLRAQMEVTDFFRTKHELRKKDILLDDFPNHVMRYTLKNTELENLSNLYIGETLTVYSVEPKVAEMLKITRKSPYLSLMGGIIENRFLSANQMVEYSTLPPIEHMHASLSLTLSGATASTRNLLQRNQMQMIQNVEQYIKDKS